MKISEAFKLYICDYVLRAGKSINTESSYLNISKSLISFFGDVDIESLSFQILEIGTTLFHLDGDLIPFVMLYLAFVWF